MTKTIDNIAADSAATTVEKPGKPLFFSGSNSAKSINRLLIEALAQHTGHSKANIIDLRNYPMPLYSDTEEEKGIPGEAHTLLEIIESHDILIIAIPEHNSGMPAFFKNIVDWMSRTRTSYKVLHGKKVILLSASPAGGGQGAMLNAKIVLEAIGACVIGHAVIRDFYQNTVLENNQLLIHDTQFVTHFKALMCKCLSAV
jgi:NAD(P)H-dependent FMN reductase